MIQEKRDALAKKKIENKPSTVDITGNESESFHIWKCS